MFFKYRCLVPTALRTVGLNLRGCQREPSPQQPSKYLPPFWHIKSKVISISSPLGSGKTTQIVALKEHDKPKRVLVITCRRGDGPGGRFEGFTSYLDAINEDLQTIKYESLLRLNALKCDMVILDEKRTTLNLAVCRETNNGYLNKNMEKLHDLIYSADRVVFADADLHVDGAVDSCYAAVFKDEEIHPINHTAGGQELHVKWADDVSFVPKHDLRDGKNIEVCCGSAQELRTLEKVALAIVGTEEVGVYYANSPNQAEIVGVYAHWSKYKLIGFTCKVTVSVDSKDGVHFPVEERMRAAREDASGVKTTRTHLQSTAGSV